MKTFKQYIVEQRVDKHPYSGHVVIDGHVFRDSAHGAKTKHAYGRYSIKDPDYVKDPKEVGMHRNYRRPDTLPFSTLGDAKKWVKSQPKKSKEDIDRIHKKYADREAEYNN